MRLYVFFVAVLTGCLTVVGGSALALVVLGPGVPPRGPRMGCTHNVQHAMTLAYEDENGAIVRDLDRTFFVPADDRGRYPLGLATTLQALRLEMRERNARLTALQMINRFHADQQARDGEHGACVGKALERLFGYGRGKPE